MNESKNNDKRYTINDLIGIMVKLRSENGCPWDREQTHKSIRSNLIEETYEVIEAIDNDDYALMREELGDLLLQIVFHSRMAEENRAFDFNDVCNDICVKLIERHPHIFSSVKVNGTDDVLKNWDAIKQKTKGRTTTKEVLEGVSKALPSLMRAQKLAHKAAKAGNPIISDSGEAERISDDESAEKALGDKLLHLAAEADMLGIDAEEALYGACERFIEKF